MKHILEIPEEIEPELMVAIGYPDKEPVPPPKIALEEITYLNRYGDKLFKKDDEDMDNKKKGEGNEYLFELVTFLAVSASGCIDEPPNYGALRLIEALSRLADLPKHSSCLSEDKFLMGIKKV